MKIHHSMESGSTLVTHISGKATVIEVLAACNSIQQYIVDGELYEIAIFDAKVCLKDLIPKARKIAYKFHQSLKKADKIAIAIVAANDLITGLFNIIKIQPENDKIKLKVFRSEDDARAWIQGCRHETGMPVIEKQQPIIELPYSQNSFPKPLSIISTRHKATLHN